MIIFLMVDIHSHILREVDDGASNLDESLAMIRAAAEAGTTDIVATPHMNSRFAFQADVSAQRIAEITPLAPEPLRIHPGCEVHLSLENIELVLQSPARYTLNRSHYLLLELPCGPLGRHVESVLKLLLDRGISPIVAHPERNPGLQSKPQLLEDWVEFGCLLQLTAQSILGEFGGAARSSSTWILQRGLAHVVASDCHDPIHRHPRLRQAYTAVSSRYGADYADLLFRENPRSVIRGSRLAEGRQTVRQSSAPWWRFWG